jgi:conjugative relaxase-like TrwC/TraI family protein
MVKGFDKFDANTAGGMHGKHYSHNDYYEKEQRVEGRVFGNLAKDVGLEEGKTITSKQFKDLSENKHAVTGEKLTREVEGRKPFCDMTVSMPKTWSIQDNIACDERVRGYHRQAKEKVKGEFYRIVGRQAHNGVEHLERTGNLAGVEYEHDTNRCMEVQTHTHLILWNVSRSENGKLYAIDFREFMDQSPYLTAIYWDGSVGDY